MLYFLEALSELFDSFKGYLVPIAGALIGTLIGYRIGLHNTSMENRRRFRMEMARAMARFSDGHHEWMIWPQKALLKRWNAIREDVLVECAGVAEDIHWANRLKFNDAVRRLSELSAAEIRGASTNPALFDGDMDFPDEVASRYVWNLLKSTKDSASEASFITDTKEIGVRLKWEWQSWRTRMMLRKKRV